MKYKTIKNKDKSRNCGNRINPSQHDRTGEINFGVVMGAETGFQDMIVLDVVFPTDRLYTFASHCQPYRDWLDENGF